MSMHTKGLIAVILAGTVGMVQITWADTVSYATGAPQFSEYYEFDETAVDDAFFAQLPIAGLPKFDTSLGTLTGVTLDIDFDYSVYASLEATGVTDPSLPHSVAFDTSFVDFEFIYSTTGAGYVLGSMATVDALSCGGGIGAGPCYTDFFDSDNWSESGMDPTSVGGYDAADFTGVGSITALALWFVIYELNITDASNVDGLLGYYTVDSDAYVPPDHNFITIHYEYTPATVVPVPAAVWLFGSGLMGLIGVANRKKIA